MKNRFLKNVICAIALIVPLIASCHNSSSSNQSDTNKSNGQTSYFVYDEADPIFIGIQKIHIRDIETGRVLGRDRRDVYHLDVGVTYRLEIWWNVDREYDYSSSGGDWMNSSPIIGRYELDTLSFKKNPKVTMYRPDSTTQKYDEIFYISCDESIADTIEFYNTLDADNDYFFAQIMFEN